MQFGVTVGEPNTGGPMVEGGGGIAVRPGIGRCGAEINGDCPVVDRVGVLVNEDKQI